MRKNATLYLVAATGFVNYHDIGANPEERCRNYLAGMEKKSYKILRDEHVQDYQSLFNRVSLDLGCSDISYRPTDERLISFYDDEDLTWFRYCFSTDGIFLFPHPGRELNRLTFRVYGMISWCRRGIVNIPLISTQK